MVRLIRKNFQLKRYQLEAKVFDFAQNPVQQQIENIWREVLDVERGFR